MDTDNRSSLARQWRLLQLLQPAPHYRTVKELAQTLAAESYKGGYSNHRAGSERPVAAVPHREQ